MLREPCLGANVPTGAQRGFHHSGLSAGTGQPDLTCADFWKPGVGKPTKRWHEPRVDPGFRQGKKEFAFAAVSVNGMNLQHLKPVSPTAASMHRAVRQQRSLEKWGNTVEAPSEQPDLTVDRKIVLRAVAQNGEALQHAAPEFRSDKEVVIQAVSSWGQALRFADPTLRGDADVVLAAAGSSGNALWHADPALLDDASFMCGAVKKHARALVHASQRLVNDKQFLMQAAAANGLCLIHMEPRFRADRDLVLAAVQSNGLALQYASFDLREDREVVAAATGQNGHAFLHAAHSLRDDRKAMLRSISTGCYAMQHATENNRADFEFMIDVSHRPGGGQSVPYQKRMQMRNKESTLKFTAEHWLPQADEKPQSTGAALRLKKHALKEARRGASQSAHIFRRTEGTERSAFLTLGANAPTKFD